MDQDSTKDGTGGGNRRNWRERLGVGQDLPKISDEFSSVDGNARLADESLPETQAGPRPGAPVSRPAPMAPRYARPAAAQPGNGSSSGPDTQGPKPVAGSPGQKPWAAPVRPAPKPGEPGRPAASHAPSPAPGSERPGHAPRANPAPAPQRPAPTRGPAAYAQAAARPGAASGHDSFGERLRAQREAAERLAQQRLAAARERSSQARTDPLTILTPRKQDTTPHARPESPLEPPAHTKPAGTEQPRFTFAEQEIVAAQQETAFSPATPPAAGGSDERKSDAGVPPGAPKEPDPQPATEDFVAPEPRPELPADYRHEDDGIFENEQPELQTAPARASAADYSAAYREFEDEFEEDEPRRGSGPLLLLLSLAAVAVVSGGLIYWYQQQASAPAPEARELPVISAPQEPVKAEPEPPPEQQLQLQQAAQPTTRKQIYDRIIGEETLEPERIVPTEEEPQLRQIQQRQQPRENPGTARQEESSEPLPLPLPPPPGTGEQGDLLVPGMADTQTASASPEPAELTLPAPAEDPASAPAPAEAPSLEQAAIVPASDDPPSPATTAGPELRDTTVAGEPASASIYPELTEPLAYPTIVESPARDQLAEPGEAAVADVPEPASQVETATAVTEAETETEAEVAQTSDIPLPRAKPEPPVRTATAQAPQAQPEPRPQPSGSGPVQILPSNIAAGQAPAQSRAVQQLAAQPAPRQRTIGRDFDPLAGQRSTFSGSSDVGPGAAVDQPAQPAPAQQVASVAPDAATSQPQGLGGYVVQLASFRSEGDAQNDHQRLVQRHPQLVSGLKSRIREASLGQSGSFYRLSLGPLADRSAATKLCNDLIAAGEKDCLVRRQ
jgi:hypothetical protein